MEGNQLLFALHSRHDELANRDKENIRANDNGNGKVNRHRAVKRPRNNPYVKLDTQNHEFKPRQEQRGGARSSSATRRAKKQSFAYVSPFVKKAAEKALKRAIANARLLPSRPPMQMPTAAEGNNTSNTSIRSADIPKKRAKAATDWNFDAKTPALFDPKLQKQEIFRPQPRIPEVRLRPSGTLGVGTQASAVAAALGLKTDLDDDDGDSFDEGAGASAIAGESSRRSTSPGPSFSLPMSSEPRRGRFTSRLAGPSSDEGESLSPPTSSSPPRFRSSAASSTLRRIVPSSAQRHKHRQLPQEQGATRMVTRSVSPIDERLAEAILRETSDEPLDALFPYHPHGSVGSIRSRAGGGGEGGSSEMLSSMAQVLTAVSELVQSINRPTAPSSPWSKRWGAATTTAGIAAGVTPGRATSQPGQGSSSALQIKYVEDTLQEMHRRDLQGLPNTVPAAGAAGSKTSTTAAAKAFDGAAGSAASVTPPAVLTKAAVADLLLSKLQALEEAERETLAMLQEPPGEHMQLPTRRVVDLGELKDGVYYSSSSGSSSPPSAGPHAKAAPSSSSSSSSSSSLASRQDATRLPRPDAPYPRAQSGSNPPKPPTPGRGLLTYVGGGSVADSVGHAAANSSGLSAADARYFSGLERDAAMHPLQLVAPRAVDTYETAITSMIQAQAIAAQRSDGAPSPAAMPGSHRGKDRYGRANDASFLQSLFSPRLGDRAREEDHNKHLEGGSQVAGRQGKR